MKNSLKNITEICRYQVLRELVYSILVALVIVGNTTTIGITAGFNQTEYLFAKKVDESDENVKWLLEKYPDSFKGISQESGNILGYWSDDLFIELHSGFYAASKQIGKRSEQGVLDKHKILLLMPADVVLLALHEPEKEADGRVVWTNQMNAFISQLEDGECTDIESMKNFLQSFYHYFLILSKKLNEEGDPAANFAMIGKGNNARLIGNGNGEKAVRLVLELYYVSAKTNIDLIVSLLQNLLWIPDAKSKPEVIAQQIAELIKMSKEDCLAAIKWANLGFHTEAQCIVLNEIKVYGPTKSPLVSLQNPCTSCFRLPYIFELSKNGFFYFALCDDFYSSYPGNILGKLKNMNVNQLTRIKDQIKKLPLRPWLGLDETLIQDFKKSPKGVVKSISLEDVERERNNNNEKLGKGQKEHKKGQKKLGEDQQNIE